MLKSHFKKRRSIEMSCSNHPARESNSSALRHFQWQIKLNEMISLFHFSIHFIRLKCFGYILNSISLNLESVALNVFKCGSWESLKSRLDPSSRKSLIFHLGIHKAFRSLKSQCNVRTFLAKISFLST